MMKKITSLKISLGFFVLAVGFAILAAPSGGTVWAADSTGLGSNAQTLQPGASAWVAIIPVLAPACVAGVKWLAPLCPKWVLPLLCSLFGLLAALLGNSVGIQTGEAWMGPVLGALGVFVREVYDQLRKLKEPKNGTVSFAALLILGGAIGLGNGCARFNTVQKDISYETNGIPKRTITTEATSYTFFAGKSELANWKAQQTDKSQGASVGALNQQSEVVNTNAVELFRSGIGAAVEAAVKGVK